MNEPDYVIQTHRLLQGSETSDAAIKSALTRGAKLAKVAPQAAKVEYMSVKKRMELTFPDGSTLGLPIAQFDEFARLTEKQRTTVQLAYNGSALRVEDADLVVSIAGMVAQLDMAHTLQRIAASLAGSVTTNAKAAAARANGSAGGRPRKSVVLQSTAKTQAARHQTGTRVTTHKAVSPRTVGQKITSKVAAKPRGKAPALSKAKVAKKAVRKAAAKKK